MPGTGRGFRRPANLPTGVGGVVVCSWLLLGLAAGLNPAQAASFERLGDVPGGPVHSAALAVSADGATIVGQASPDFGTEAFRWTTTNGLRALGDLSGGQPHSIAHGISADGLVAVGIGTAQNTSSPEAVSWSNINGLQPLVTPWDGVSGGVAYATSGDGSVVVGTCTPLSGSAVAQAFIWSPSSGLQTLSDLPGGADHAAAYDANADASVVVGLAHTADGTQAFVWTIAGGLTSVPGVGPGSCAHAVAADGSVIVGEVAGAAFRATGDTAERLPSLPGQTLAVALGVSDDGSVIVGRARVDGRDRAILWTAATGTVDLESRLVDAGVTLDGWSLRDAVDISADGTIVVGTATHPDGRMEAYRADLSGLPAGDNLAQDDPAEDQTPPPVADELTETETPGAGGAPDPSQTPESPGDVLAGNPGEPVTDVEVLPIGPTPTPIMSVTPTALPSESATKPASEQAKDEDQDQAEIVAGDDSAESGDDAALDDDELVSGTVRLPGQASCGTNPVLIVVFATLTGCATRRRRCA